MTPFPAEKWDDDDDFDLSGLSHHALGLPRSEKSSEDARHVHGSGRSIDERGRVRRVIDDDNRDNGEKRSWDFDFDDISDHDNKNRENGEDDEYDDDDDDDDDDDKVNTLKLSDLTSATLAQLASLRKSSKPSPENQDLASLSIENLSGKVTNLGSFSHRSHITHADTCDWDEGLELPDAFPVLRSTRGSKDEMALSNEAHLEAPSLGSLSDVTTVDSLTSGSRDRSLTHSSAASKDDRVSRSSTSSHSSAVGFRPGEPAVKVQGDDSEDSSFELSGSISKLQLNPRLLCKAHEVTPNRVVEVSRMVRAAELRNSAEVKNVNAIRSLRYLNTTAASRARQTNNSDHRGATTSAPWPSRIMREPRRVRNYGNGMELDSFADLPIHQTFTPHREAESANWRDRKAEVQTIVRVASGSTWLPADNASRGKARKTRRKEPTLIRNLGGPSTVPRIVGDMRWNPAVQRWEGNEEEGRSFEMAVTGRGKGGAAHGAKLSAGSAKVILGPTRKAPARQHVGDKPSPMPSMDARLVGDMFFDPIRLCWLNKNKEDEIDPFAEMDEEWEDPDSFRRGSPTGRNGSSSSVRPRSELGRTREPQWSAAAIGRVLRGRNKDSVPDALANRIPTYLWLECIAAKRRHDEQIAGFIPTISQQRSAFHRATRAPKNDRSRHLHLIQMLARRGDLD